VRTWLIVSALLLAGFAPAPLPKRDRNPHDQRLPEGTWVVGAVRYQGNEVLACFHGDRGIDVALGDRVVIRGGRITFAYRNDPSRAKAWSFRLSGSGPTRALDLLGPQPRPFGLLGICALEGDALTLSVSAAGETRPQTFAGKESALVIVLARR
jgi:uncharacterized protein (TIGR03067 family)